MFVFRTPYKVPHPTATAPHSAGTQHLIFATKIAKKNNPPNTMRNNTHTRTKIM